MPFVQTISTMKHHRFNMNILPQAGEISRTKMFRKFHRVLKNKGNIFHTFFRTQDYKIEIFSLLIEVTYLHLFRNYFRPSTLNSDASTYSKRLAESENATRRSSLPKALNRSAPESSIRLTVFGTSDIVNNLDETDMSDSLNGIPVRFITTKNLSDFREKIEMVCISNPLIII